MKDEDEDKNVDRLEDEDVPEEELEEEEAEPEEPEEPAEPEGEEDVQKAKKFGHISKEDWIASGKDPSAYKTPAEFNKTAEAIDQHYSDKFASLKKKVDQRDREIQALVDYQQRTAQREYERAKQEVEQRLAASKDDMDMEGVSRYSQELVRLQDNEAHTHIQKMNELQKEAQNAFIERNEHWFNDRNPDLKARAIEIDNELKGIYPNATYHELASKIEARMQYEHPDRVLGQVKARGPGLASANNSSVNKTAMTKKHVLRNLSQEHQDTYRVYKRINPKTTEADFIQKLKADGEL